MVDRCTERERERERAKEGKEENKKKGTTYVPRRTTDVI